MVSDPLSHSHSDSDSDSDSDPDSPEASPHGPKTPIVPPRPIWFRVHPLVVGAAGAVAGLIVGVGLFGVGSALSDVAETRRQDAQRATAEAAAARDRAARSTLLSNAVASCGLDSSDAEIGDEGLTLDLENRGQDDYAGVSSADLWCFVEEMKTPSSIVSHKEQTTSMDGRQVEEFDGIEVSWSYHPDRGMDSIWTVARSK